MSGNPTYQDLAERLRVIHRLRVAILSANYAERVKLPFASLLPMRVEGNLPLRPRTVRVVTFLATCRH